MNSYKFSDLSLNMTEEFFVQVTESMLFMFFHISGDNNPLHVDEEYAIQKGFRHRVVYGLMTSSFFSTLIGTKLPGKYALLHAINILFNHPVFVGDTLNVKGTIIYINEACKQIELKGVITNQCGLQVSKANIKVGLHE